VQVHHLPPHEQPPMDAPGQLQAEIDAIHRRLATIEKELQLATSQESFQSLMLEMEAAHSQLEERLEWHAYGWRPRQLPDIVLDAEPCQVTVLDLASDPVIQEVLSRLRGDPSLHTLCLVGLPLSQEVILELCDALKANSSLKALHLINSIHESFIGNLVQGVCRHSSIAVLDLSDNSITDRAAPVLAKAIEDAGSLTELRLCLNCMSEAGAVMLAGAINRRNNPDMADAAAAPPAKAESDEEDDEEEPEEEEKRVRLTAFTKLDLRGNLGGRGAIFWGHDRPSTDERHNARAMTYHNRVKAVSLAQEYEQEPGLYAVRCDAQRFRNRAAATQARGGNSRRRTTFVNPPVRNTFSRSEQWSNIF